ncbi:transglycosylase SLT domain-containing protein [Streptomyces sp. NPDC018019]|uniref:aggregation-promoting factor C-terminal-like domain-containing protein n=1 Tax=Streptomyces sp. NPDC018019 TaxID=3365030 RepID=UPI003793FEA3
MATITALNFNINTRYSGTGIAEARAAMTAFDEEVQRQNRARAVTEAQRHRLEAAEAAARLTAQRRELDQALREREAAWVRELTRRQNALAAQVEADRQHWVQIRDNQRTALSNIATAFTKSVATMLNAILLLGPAIVPIAGGLAAVGAAAGTSFALAGAAAGFFGAALMGAVQATVGANSAVGATGTALNAARNALDRTVVGTKEYAAAQAKVTQLEKAHEAALRALPPVQEAFARSVDGTKDAWQKFIQSTTSSTLRPATTMVQAATYAIPQLTSVVKAVAPEMQRVADATKRWVTEGGLDRFLTFVKMYGVPALHNFIEAGRSLFDALGTGMRATAPLGVAFSEWVLKASEAFKQWASGGGFERFLQWFQSVKGDLLAALQDLGTFMANLGTAMADMSGMSFGVIMVFLNVLSKFPPELIEAIAYGWLAWNAALLAYNVIAGISAGVTAALALAAAPFGLLLAGMALTIGLVILALAALAVGIFFLVKYWDTVWNAVKKTASAVWNWLRDTWTSIWDGIKQVATTVWKFLTNGWGQLILGFLGPIGVLIFIAAHWDEIWTGIKTVALAVWDALKAAWNVLWGALKAVWDAFIGPIKEAWNSVWPELKLAATNVWNALKAAWDFLWGGITLAWDVFWSVFGPTFKAAWNGIVSVAKAAWNVLKAGWELIWAVIKGVFDVAWAVLSSAWQIGWTWLTGAAKIAWSVLTSAWEVLWAVIKGVWNAFYGVFKAVFTSAWDVIKAIATGAWNVLKVAWDAFWKAITAVWRVFLAFFTGNWSGAWKAIREAAEAVWSLLKAVWTAFLNAMRALLNAFISIFTALWNGAWNLIRDVAAAVWNAIRTVFSAFLNALKALWNTVWNAIKNVFNAVVEAIKNIALAAWNLIRSQVEFFLAVVKAAWNTAWTAIKTAFQNVVNAVKVIADALWDALRAVFNAGKDFLLNTFWNPVKNFFTKTIPGAFESAVRALGVAWDKLKQAVRAPIQAVVDVVYNGGIVKLWNLVAKVFNAPGLSNFTLPKFAKGGPVEGPGSGTSDSIAARLSAGEHVWTAKEVQGAGGHEAVAQMRRNAMGGQKVRTYGTGKRFDEGGGILGTGWGPDFGPDLVPDGILGNALGTLKDLALGAISGPFSAAVDLMVSGAKKVIRGIVPGDGSPMEKLATGIPDKIGEIAKSWVSAHDIAADVGGGDAAAGLAWAKTQAGKPYQWGGNGNPSWDCSGFMSAIESVIRGEKPHRRWATGAFSGGTAPPGWKLKDKAPFMVGITNAGVGHTAGTLNGTNVECRGGQGCIVGKGARGYSDGMFTSWYGLGPSKDVGGGAASGTSAAAAQATAKSFLSAYGWGTDQWSGLQALWQRESGWNYKASNPSSGAYGIPQALPGSKMASSGKDWKSNPATQIKWGLGYIKGRYKTPNAANAFQKANNWYGSGTRSAQPGWAVVGDQGPELMRMRGGEDIRSNKESLAMVGSGDDHFDITVPVTIQGNATPATVDKLTRELPSRLQMALAQGVGRRP